MFKETSPLKYIGQFSLQNPYQPPPVTWLPFESTCDENQIVKYPSQIQGFKKDPFLDRHYVWWSHDPMSGIWSIFF